MTIVFGMSHSENGSAGASALVPVPPLPLLTVARSRAAMIRRLAMSLGLDVESSEDGAGWLAFLLGLAARGLHGVQLVASNCPHGLRDAIAAALPGAAWQTCRAHYSPNLATRCPSPPSRGCLPWSGLSSTWTTPARTSWPSC